MQLKRKRGRITGEPWSIFWLNTILNGAHDVGVICDQHTDPKDKQGTQCQRSLCNYRDVAQQNEYVLKLKRWLLAGFLCEGPLDKRGHMAFQPRSMEHGDAAEVEELGAIAVAQRGELTTEQRNRIRRVLQLPAGAPSVAPRGAASSAGS